MSVVDIFAGLGGWDVAARDLGIEVIGIELDAAACATRDAAGLRTMRGDVATLDPAIFAPVRAILGSPPCQTFSTAGNRAGLADAEVLEAALQRIEAGLYDTRDLGDRACATTTWRDAAARCSDARSALVLEPLRWALAHRATLCWIALEQVPPVLPFWRRFAAIFESWGFTTWTGILNAADYGVPQTRRRAILIASRDSHRVARPAPTHFDPRKTLPLFGKPWVSMAEALDLTPFESVGLDRNVQPKRTKGGQPGGNRRSTDAPAMTLRAISRSWNRRDDLPAPVVCGHRAPRWCFQQPATTLLATGRTSTGTRVRVGKRALRILTNLDQRPDGSRQARDLTDPAPSFTATSGSQWKFERPATTIVGSFSPDIVSPPDHRDRSTSGPHRQDGGVPITEREALILQSFPPDYPVQGSRTKRFEQIGNAIPPGLAIVILRQLIGGA